MAKKLEIERKFLLRRLPVDLKYHEILHIFQFYLKDGSRIRETRNANPNRGLVIPFPFGVNPKFELTIKNKLKPGVYEEDEKEIKRKEFDNLKRTATHQIRKTRYVHKLSKKLKWEIDVYDGIAMVTAEIELPKEGASFSVPKELSKEMIMDVTEFPQFTNRSIADRVL